MDSIYTMLGLQPFNETQVKILNAAKRCLLKWGVEKTNIKDISEFAGVTRPTVYANFNTKEKVIEQSLLLSGYQFACKLIDHISTFGTTRERYIEAVIFAIEQLPKEPFLSVIVNADFSDLVKRDALQNPKGIILCMSIFERIFQDNQLEQRELLEIIEITIRVSLSMIMIESPIERSREELRGFLERRLLVATGLK